MTTEQFSLPGVDDHDAPRVSLTEHPLTELTDDELRAEVARIRSLRTSAAIAISHKKGRKAKTAAEVKPITLLEE